MKRATLQKIEGLNQRDGHMLSVVDLSGGRDVTVVARIVPLGP